MQTFKQIKLFILVAMMIVPAIASAQDRIIDEGQIPAAIKNYIKTHFPEQSIAKAEIDGREYEIKLDNHTELEFNSKYAVIKIDSHTALPVSVIPLKIREYVASHYPKNAIVHWELEWKHQEVKLDNGIELEFTMKNTFVRVDN